MKKLFLTTVVALFSFAASAQFLVATELSKTDDGEGGESYSIEGLTNNMSFGYEVMDKITIGITMKDATTNTAAVDWSFAGDSVLSSVGFTSSFSVSSSFEVGFGVGKGPSCLTVM